MIQSLTFVKILDISTCALFPTGLFLNDNVACTVLGTQCALGESKVKFVVKFLKCNMIVTATVNSSRQRVRGIVRFPLET